MRALVTGAAGFVGKAVSQAFEGAGWTVVPFDASLGSSDVSDPASVAQAFEGEPFDAVVHLAYLMGAESEADPVAAMRVNALGTAVLFAAAAKAKAKRVIFLSSESVYGRSQAAYGDRGVTEEDFCAPAAHALNYSLTKLLNEHLAAKFEAKSGTEYVCLRAPVVYGAGRKRGTTAWASDVATLPAQGKSVILPFPSSDRNCYLYVGDLGKQIVALAAKPKLQHRIYNAGGDTLSAAEIAALVQKIVPGAQIAFTETAPPSPFVHRMDDARIRAEIGNLRRPMLEGIQTHVQEARR